MALFRAVVAAFAALACLANVAFAMNASVSELGYRDLVERGIVNGSTIVIKQRAKGPSKTHTVAKKVVIARREVLLIAQAKLHVRRFPVTPSVTVDVQPTVPGCGFYDWLFLPHCAHAAPRSNEAVRVIGTVKLPRSTVHVYSLPLGWKNSRVAMGVFGKCGEARTATMRAASLNDRLCHRAQYRYRYCWRKCKLLCKRRCRWVECDSSHILIRHLSHRDSVTTTAPQVLSDNGSPYAGFTRCSNHEALHLFVK